jgi:hypothetical protein
MPLSDPAPREHLHTRRVECRGFRRSDGLWDIEGHLTDVKTYSFPSDEYGEVVAGAPVHEMWLRMTVDDGLTIHAIEAATDASPYRLCPDIAPNFQRLVGLRIGPGFTAKVRERVGGVEGCTHLVELTGPIATTAFQTIFPVLHRERRERERREGKRAESGPAKRPRLLGTCHAFAPDSEITKRNWPEFYTGR